MKDDNTIRQLSAPAPISEQKWPEEALPIVSISCITYNHENFIQDCLDGFLMQETQFPVEILIHDDASTDQTATIIREYERRYPNVIKAICQKENQWSKGIRPNPEFNFPRARGKYIAFCEGDDFWTDKNKLQKQVAIVAKSPHVKLCFHKVFVRKEGGGDKGLTSFPGELAKDLYSCEELVTQNIIPTCSVLAVREAVIDTPSWYYRLPMNDWPRWIMACKDGYAHGINKEMGVYRKHDGGVWSPIRRSAQLTGTYDFYCELEKNGPPLAKIAAARARRALFLMALDLEQSSLKRINNHVVFGPLLKVWRKFINKNFLHPNF
ncbi:glycosyltransferase [Desulfopila sp. IMCC35008]|uniref:glycosyltransferase n=1 Tax=Desulfopila sp. IMCC35008 TaxID=2653858 RepID=UPI0013D829BE|nr:glycosyltransferase [Desulfopila sp. IMCC35008]